MKKFFLSLAAIIIIAATVNAFAAGPFESDVIETGEGDLKITFIGHGTLMFEYEGKVLHVDPWTRLADYTTLPKADIILVTHEHRDHLDAKAIDILKGAATRIVLTDICAEKIPGDIVMKNGDTQTVYGFAIEAVPAYNIVHKRSDGTPYHPKGDGNGYVINFGGSRVYVAGDTEDIPEMEKLENIYIAFLPMNLPYTMSPEMAARAARILKPKILYPYHFSDTDTSEIIELLKDQNETEVRIRKMN